MPRSVLVASDDPALFETLRTAVGDDARLIDAGGLVHCDGSAAPLTNIYPIDLAPADRGDWAAASAVMNAPTMTALVLECRSAAWVAEVGRLLAAAAASPIWIIDAADVVWPAGEVDSERIALT